MAEMTLYHGEPNGSSLTVLAALAECGLDAELVAIDLAAGERHSGSVPHGVATEMSVEGEGPVLEVGGEAMADSVFIAQYLDERAGAGLQPTDAHARWEMEMWCRQTIERIAPAAAFLGNRAHTVPRLAAMPDAEFDTILDSIASEDLRRRWADTRAGDFPDAQEADSRSKIVQGVERIETRLGDGRDWLMGDFSIADLESFAWLAGMEDIVPEAFEGKARATAWIERMRARPSVAQALSHATSDDPRASWAPGPEINRWG